MRFVLFKRDLIVSHASHFAGGKHAFISLSESLREQGHEVHVVSISTKGQLMAASVSGGRPACALHDLALAPALAPGLPRVVRWQDKQTAAITSDISVKEKCGGPNTDQRMSLTYHIVLSDDGMEEGNEGRSLNGGDPGRVSAGVCYAIQAALDGSAAEGRGGASSEKRGGKASAAECLPWWVIIDADDSQLSKLIPHHQESLLRPQGNHHPCEPYPSSSLFSAVTHRFGRHCLALVQNVHFLPFGPSGTAARSKDLLEAWSILGGVICVSLFVKNYLHKWTPGIFQVASDPDQHSGNALQEHYRLEFKNERQHVADSHLIVAENIRQNVADSHLKIAECSLHSSDYPLPSGNALPWVCAVPLSAWGCFGGGPYEDFGSNISAALLKAHISREEVSEQIEGCKSRLQLQEQDQTFLRMKTVGILKMTAEKGASVVLEVAKRMGHLHFIVVAGDPQVQQALSSLPNIEVVEPVANIDLILSRVALILAPSLWLEAWGMVVTEAMLRGIPCIVSDAGALPEAALGITLVIPVQTIVIPLSLDTSTPDWSKREYPKQQVEGWLEAISEILTDPYRYQKVSQTARARAHDFVRGGGEARDRFLDFLDSFAAQLGRKDLLAEVGKIN